MANTFSFPQSYSNIEQTLFSRTFPGRLLLKLIIYWNKSIQSLNIIITANEYQEWIPNIDREILKKLAMRRKCDFKKVEIMNVDIIPWMFPRYLLGHCHNLQLLFWNFSRKIYLLQLWKTDLIPQYLLRMLSYSAADFFTFFNKSSDGGSLSESLKK